MFSFPRSVVYQILRCGVLKNRNLKKNMSNYKIEKQKFLDMDIDKKRNLNKHFIKLDDVPTWKKYASEKSLPIKLNALGEKSIDSSKNKVLAEKVSIYCGDITTLEVDAVVNAANVSLLGGGGVDGAIHRGAGPDLLEECKTLGGCTVGDAKMTGGYKLPAKYVIHTVGPKGEKPGDLKNCYMSCLKIMLIHNLKTIAFPCISTGVYGYPNHSAAHVAISTIRKFLEGNADLVDRVIFCLFLDIDIEIYEGLLQSYFPLK